ALLPLVLEHYELKSIREIRNVIYADGFTRDQVSEIAPEVVRIAGMDDIAYGIVTGAGEKLATIALGTIQQVHPPGDDVDVYPTGGVFGAGPLITDPFRKRLARQWPTATIREPRFPPVAGALIQAIRTLGIDITPDLRDRIGQTIPLR